jgi:hypothetical protein
LTTTPPRQKKSFGGKEPMIRAKTGLKRERVTKKYVSTQAERKHKLLIQS